MSKIFRGGCYCGSVRFEVTGQLEKPHACSCAICRKHTGALVACWVEVPNERIEWADAEAHLSKIRSSDFSSRAFCRNCGSSLGAIDDAPVVALLTGVFDDVEAAELVPESHAHAENAPAWCAIPRATGNAA